MKKFLQQFGLRFLLVLVTFACYQVGLKAAEIELDEITMQVLDGDDAGSNINELSLPTDLQMIIDAAEHALKDEKEEPSKEQDAHEDSKDSHDEASTESKDNEEHTEAVEKPEEPESVESPEEPESVESPEEPESIESPEEPEPVEQPEDPNHT